MFAAEQLGLGLTVKITPRLMVAAAGIPRLSFVIVAMRSSSFPLEGNKPKPIDGIKIITQYEETFDYDMV